MEFDLTESITAFGDLSYYTAESTMRRQPLVLNAPGTDKAIVLSANNPYNPWGSSFYSTTGDGVTRLAGTPRGRHAHAGRDRDLAPEVIVTDNDALRVVAGLRGGFGDTSWKWEGSLFYNVVNGQDDATPDVRESLLQAAANRTDASRLQTRSATPSASPMRGGGRPALHQSAVGAGFLLGCVQPHRAELDHQRRPARQRHAVQLVGRRGARRSGCGSTARNPCRTSGHFTMA